MRGSPRACAPPPARCRPRRQKRPTAPAATSAPGRSPRGTTPTVNASSTGAERAGRKAGRRVSRLGSPRSASNGVSRRTSRTVTRLTAANATSGPAAIHRPCTSLASKRGRSSSSSDRSAMAPGSATTAHHHSRGARAGAGAGTVPRPAALAGCPGCLLLAQQLGRRPHPLRGGRRHHGRRPLVGRYLPGGGRAPRAVRRPPGGAARPRRADPRLRAVPRGRPLRGPPGGVVAEANAIGTTYLRAQTLAEPGAAARSPCCARYTDLALESPTRCRGAPRWARPTAQEVVQRRLWRLAGEAPTRARATAPRLYVDTLNAMIDQQTVRVAALNNRVPGAVLISRCSPPPSPSGCSRSTSPFSVAGSARCWSPRCS